MDNEYLLTLEHISKAFSSVKALDDVGFSVKKGVIHALMGENGAGKSTLIKILTGVYTPDFGAKITIDGKTFSSMNPMLSVRSGIAVTYQDFSLFPNLTVVENIAISRELERGAKVIDWKVMRKEAKAAMERMGISIDMDAQLGTLSAAKQQLVAITRALVYRAKLLILDEPTSTLSTKEVENLIKIIRKLRDDGISILFISHKLDEVFAVAQQITVLRDGTFIGTYDTDQITQNDIIEHMVGRKVQYIRNAPKNPSDEVVLEVKNLSKKGNFADISFQLHKGEILALTGLVGAGRTELCETVYGIKRPDSGEILYEGKPAVIANSQEASRMGIALVPEDRRTQGLVIQKSVKDNITISVLDKLKNRFGLIRRKKEKELADSYIEQLKIKPAIAVNASGNLSGGNQQRVVIARCLALQPKVLIIDEPTNGIDIGAKQEIHDLLTQLAQQGMAIIMISSELPEVLAVANRVLVMRRGRIVWEFQGEEATQSAIMHKAIL